MAKCQQCGTEAASNFCPSCGARVVQGPPPVAAAPQAPQYPPQQPVPPQFPPPGYQQGYQGYPTMPPARPSSPWKWVGIIGGALGLLLVVVIVLLSALGGGSTVGAPVITTQVDQETFQPKSDLKTIPPATDLIFAAFEVDVKQGDVLLAKWYYNGAHQAHLDTELAVDEDTAAWASFNIDNGGKPWPAGQYKFEIYLNGEKAQEKSFSVK